MITMEELEAFRDRLTPDAYRVAEAVVSGLTLLEAMRALKMGQPRFYGFLSGAEAVIGQTLRRPHGWSANRKKRERPLETAAPATPDENRCPVCHLIEPHECATERPSRWDWTY